MNRYIFTVILILSIHSAIFSKERYLFSKISLDQGLSQSTVFDIAQDTIGFMWFATQDGLNRYDGYDIKVFKPVEQDDHSINSSYIRSLKVDSNNNVWIGTQKGVTRYDHKMDRFENYLLLQPNEDNYISSIATDSKGETWVSSRSGEIYQYCKKNNNFNKIKYISPEPINSIVSITSIDTTLLISSTEGLFELSKSNPTAKPVNFNGEKVSISAVLIDKKNGIWVGTADRGLFLLNKNYKILFHYQQNNLLQAGIINNKIRALGIDNKGKIWIGTFGGLSILDPSTKKFDNYTEENGNTFSLSQNSIRSIFMDNNQGVWIGTFYGGANYYHKDNIKFNTIDKNNKDTPLNDNVVNIIKGSNENTIWIGTNDSGLSSIDLKQNKIRHYNTQDKRNGNSNNIKAILPLDNGQLLIGTHWGGLLLFDPTKNIYKSYKKTPSANSLTDDRVDALLKDSKGTIWIGTYNGLQQFDLDRGIFHPFTTDGSGNQLSSNGILFLFEDSRNKIWIGTFNGLNVYDPEKNLLETFKHQLNNPSSISNNEVTYIFEDSKKRLWIGTAGGLNLYEQKNRNFKRIKTNEKLENAFIHAILEDSQNNLWISTNGGLTRYNTETERTVNFIKKDGLQSNQFNHASAFKSMNGKMYFGGINGITTFYPDNIPQIQINNKILINSLWINGKQVKPLDDTGILEKHISLTEEITLENDHNIFEIQFSAINFNNNNDVTYEYKLEGKQKEWNRTNLRSLTYADLEPGKYHLKIRLKSDYPEESVLNLDIIVLPPWWQTGYMYLTYAFLGFLAITFGFKIVKERIKIDNELKVEKLKKQKIEELHSMQMQFFINISHEFKTPLTLIIAPLEKLRESKINNEWQSRQIDIVYQNAKSLLSLIEQLINFRKAELRQMRLMVSRKDIIKELSNIYDTFLVLAKTKNINFIFETDKNSLVTLFDSNILERITFNLLSNAFKFTPKDGEITLGIRQNENNITIYVKDTGKGIPKELQNKVFERFFSVTYSDSLGGSGIGLTYTKLLTELHHGYIDFSSEEEKGSLFCVHFPTSEGVYEDSEIMNENKNTNKLERSNNPLYIEPINDYPSSDAHANNKEHTILIADDNLNMISYLKENLSDEYHIETALDGEEALTMVNNKQYDLILSDVMMPKMNGITFCKKVKQNFRTCHIPVILLTAKSEMEHKIEGIEVGADDYIGKPFSLKLLKLTIKNNINSRKHLKEKYKEGMDLKTNKTAFYELDQEFLTKCSIVIENHLEDPNFSVEQFAEEMCMSRSNLHLKLKAITDNSASYFIKKVRFQKALELIETGRYNVSEISTMTGFSTPSYFTKTFKKHFGCLPTDYKKKITN